ncbi:MAG: acetyl-CoA carboxylase biotin carboxyl carrier protein [Pseudomonadota bacterium]
MSKSDPIDLVYLQKLADLIVERDLSEIEIEDEKVRVRVSRETATVSVPMAAAAPAPSLAPTPAVAAVAEPAAAPAAASGTGDLPPLTSPMVGTAYLAPEPGAPNFVSVGDFVNQGQTVLIIEAMKTMNQIAADKDGIIKEILVDNAQPVEYGEPLLVID